MRGTPAVLGGVALTSALFFATAALADVPSAPTARVGQTALVGDRGSRQTSVAVFRGVPYAAPPIGRLRWAAPEPAAWRSGRRDATRFAAGCFQDDYNTVWYRRVGRAFGADPDVFQDPPFSEDCLYLNVWTPALATRDPRPVLVWIHGGSNKSGWSFEPNYDGENLAATGDVVVVSVAYRLGILGFFSHPSLHGSAAPANFGLLDQIAALRWVREHIRAFGGDPTRVTVAGESAGGADIGYLIASPLARGLFRRAIIQSGGYRLVNTADVTDAERTGALLGLSLPGTPGVAAMRRLPAATIWQAAKTALPGLEYGPVVDGRSLHEPLASAYATRGIGVDLLIGSNENEFYMYASASGTVADLVAEVPAPARDDLGPLLAGQPTPQHAEDRLHTLVRMRCPSYAMADRARDTGHPAWVYRFARVRPGPGGAALLAYHGAEIPYVFNTHDGWLAKDSADGELTRLMQGYWSRFVHSGDPNGAGAPRWSAWSDPDPSTLRLDATPLDEPAPDAGLCRRLAPILYPPRPVAS
jgi:para-nitrobenzyl esterase